MVNEQLLEYIRLRRDAQDSKEDITKALVTGGWTPADVDAGFALIDGMPSRTNANIHTSSMSRKSHTGLFITLLLLVILCVAGWVAYTTPSVKRLVISKLHTALPNTFNPSIPAPSLAPIKALQNSPTATTSSTSTQKI